MTPKIDKSKSEWKELLTKDQFRILRKKGTEIPFTGEYNDNKRKGTYLCAGCGQALFRSDTKYESGTGWPSFWAPIESESVGEHADNNMLMRRTEIVCNRCGGHLGHVFDDGPEPTGQRYCVNSLSLKFEEENPSGEDP